MDEKEEQIAFEHGYAAAAAEVFQVAAGKAPESEGKELAYDRWVRLGRDLRRYLREEEWLPRHD